MAKYMIVYEHDNDVDALFFDREDFVDNEVEELREICGTNPEVYIYTIYGYQLLYR